MGGALERIRQRGVAPGAWYVAIRWARAAELANVISRYNDLTLVVDAGLRLFRLMEVPDADTAGIRFTSRIRGPNEPLALCNCPSQWLKCALDRSLTSGLQLAQPLRRARPSGVDDVTRKSCDDEQFLCSGIDLVVNGVESFRCRRRENRHLTSDLGRESREQVLDAFANPRCFPC